MQFIICAWVCIHTYIDESIWRNLRIWVQICNYSHKKMTSICTISKIWASHNKLSAKVTMHVYACMYLCICVYICAYNCRPQAIKLCFNCNCQRCRILAHQHKRTWTHAYTYIDTHIHIYIHVCLLLPFLLHACHNNMQHLPTMLHRGNWDVHHICFFFFFSFYSLLTHTPSS